MRASPISRLLVMLSLWIKTGIETEVCARWSSVGNDESRLFFFFFQAEDGIRDYKVTGVQTCALPICLHRGRAARRAAGAARRDAPGRAGAAAVQPGRHHDRAQRAQGGGARRLRGV